MGYLVSFGDTMTALLAFFIVLNSLAKEQTGANLHAGTSSFSSAFKSMSTPGNSMTDRTDRKINQTAPAPIYALNNPKDDPEQTPGSVGPDDQDDNGRIIDRQHDDFKRFLTELEYQYQTSTERPAVNQVVFDSFQMLKPAPQVLDEGSLKLASQAIPMLRSSQYRLEIVVWANTPSSTSLQNALNKVSEIKQQIQGSFMLTPGQKERIQYVAKPWLFADAQRPTVSFVVIRVGI
jgi:flagellar motor protein MotB